MSAAALLALPGAATVFFSFHTGGFFAGTTAFGAVVVALLLVLRVTLSEQPFAGVGAAVGVAVGALALYAVWALVSTLWSDASARAVIEFDRVLLYGLALVLFGSMARDSDRVSWCLRALALGILAVCVAGFLTRTLPDVFPVELSSTSSDRLSYPIYYWNALGLLATLGLVL